MSRAERGCFTLVRQSSLAQPEGKRLPPRSAITSLRFGTMMHMPPGAPSISAMKET
jgi:hypothetical protein